MTNPGSWLRELREELHLTRMGVQRLTAEYAQRASNEHYRIGRGRLTDIERGKAVPDIFEVASLCECYRVTYSAILQSFGLRVAEPRTILDQPAELGLPSLPWPFTDTERPFSLTFQDRISFETTRLVTESAEELGVPAAVRRQLDLGQLRLGIIGLNDDTMGELVPAGSVVVIDRSSTTVEMGDWKSIRERPIYFVWHENGHSCSWCYVAHDTLFILPHPTSRKPVMMFKMPRAATIIGRVIHIWPPLIIQRPS